VRRLTAGLRLGQLLRRIFRAGKARAAENDDGVFYALLALAEVGLE